jgi:O-antigen/teichoic acid export membrane protein
MLNGTKEGGLIQQGGAWSGLRQAVLSRLTGAEGKFAGLGILAQLITLATYPLLTRIYPAGIFGEAQAFASLSVVLIVIAPLRYEFAIFLPKSDRLAAAVVELALLSVVVVALVATAGLWLVFHGWGLLSSMAKIGNLIWLMPGLVVAGAASNVLVNHGLRRKQLRNINRSRMLQVALQAVLQVAAGLFTPLGAAGLILGEFIGRATGAGLLYFRSGLGALRRTAREWKLIRLVAIRYRRFPLVGAVAALVNTCGTSIPLFLFGSYYGMGFLGRYVMADRVINLPSIFLGQVISQLFMSRLADALRQNDRTGARRLLWRYVGLCFLAILPMALIIWLVGPFAFGLVFGEDWATAGQVARQLVVYQIVGFAVWPIMPTLTLLEKQDQQLLWDCTRLALTTAAVWLSAWSGAEAIVAARNYGLAMGGSYLFYLLLADRNLRYAGKIMIKENN